MVSVVLMVRGWRVLTFCRPRDSLLTGYPSHARASTGFTLHTDCNVLLTTTARDSLVSSVLVHYLVGFICKVRLKSYHLLDVF